MTGIKTPAQNAQHMTYTERSIDVAGLNMTVDPQADYLRVAFGGIFSVSQASPVSAHVLELTQEYQAKRVLIDFREITGDPTTMERFTLSSVFAAKYILYRSTNKIPATLFAVLGNHPFVDKQKFEEHVAVNRGVPIRIFVDFHQALKWLGVDPTRENPVP